MQKILVAESDILSESGLIKEISMEQKYNTSTSSPLFDTAYTPVTFDRDKWRCELEPRRNQVVSEKSEVFSQKASERRNPTSRGKVNSNRARASAKPSKIVRGDRLSEKRPHCLVPRFSRRIRKLEPDPSIPLTENPLNADEVGLQQ